MPDPIMNMPTLMVTSNSTSAGMSEESIDLSGPHTKDTIGFWFEYSEAMGELLFDELFKHYYDSTDSGYCSKVTRRIYDHSKKHRDLIEFQFISHTGGKRMIFYMLDKFFVLSSSTYDIRIIEYPSQAMVETSSKKPSEKPDEEKPPVPLYKEIDGINAVFYLCGTLQFSMATLSNNTKCRYLKFVIDNLNVKKCKVENFVTLKAELTEPRLRFDMLDADYNIKSLSLDELQQYFHKKIDMIGELFELSTKRDKGGLPITPFKYYAKINPLLFISKSPLTPN